MDRDETAEILFPHREVPTKTEVIVVREFNFLESLKAAPVARPIIDDLARLFEECEDPEAVPLLDVLERFTAHPEAVVRLLELATGRADIAVQSVADGHALLRALWEANQAFFTEMLILRKTRKDGQSAWAPFSPSLSPTGTAAMTSPATH